MQQYVIVVDAMGGDNAPEAIVTGAADACKENEALVCVFVGDPERLEPLLRKQKLSDGQWRIVPASEVIGMDESPKEAVSKKPDASILIAAQLIRDGKGDALVSAGSTGATIMACSNEIPRMPGIERGVLAAVFPAMKQQRSDPGISIMLDVGATLHCTTTQLVSFAIMGQHYAAGVLGIAEPRIALLNIGEEETKGHGVLVDTHRALREMDDLQFIGNIEGKDILNGVADVIVTEGYTGNILLKGLEGFAEGAVSTGKRIYKKNLMSKVGLAMLSPVLKKLKKRLDYSEYGGAPFLGFRKLVIKAHGRSNAKAIKNAVLLAGKSAEANIVRRMESSMKAYYVRMFDE